MGRFAVGSGEFAQEGLCHGGVLAGLAFLFFLVLVLLFGDFLGLDRAGLDEDASDIVPDFEGGDEDFGPDFFDVEDADHAQRGELVGHLFVDAFDTLNGGVHDLEALAELVGGEDVDVPACQASGEADVLTALADGEAELVVADDDGGAAEFEAEGDFGDFGGLECVLDEDL